MLYILAGFGAPLHCFVCSLFSSCGTLTCPAPTHDCTSCSAFLVRLFTAVMFHFSNLNQP